MFGNISERPHVLPFTVSHERAMDVLGRSVQRDAQNARTVLIVECHVFGKGVGCRITKEEKTVVSDTRTKDSG